MANDIAELRSHLFGTLQGLKDKTVDVDTAKAVSQIAGNIIDTAKVEVDYLRVTGGEGTGFITQGDDTSTTSETRTGTKTVTSGRTVHRLK